MESSKLDWDRKLMTRNGFAAELLCSINNHGKFTRGVVIRDTPGGDIITDYTEEGRYSPDSKGSLDLVNVPRTFETWVAAVKYPNSTIGIQHFNSQRELDESRAHQSVIASAHVTFVEDQHATS